MNEELCNYILYDVDVSAPAAVRKAMQAAASHLKQQQEDDRNLNNDPLNGSR